MKAIIGLGNPGASYRHSRHNAGFMAADAFVAARAGSGFKWKEWVRPEGKVAAECCRIDDARRHEDSVLVAKPLTYMNRSGLAVEAILRDHEINLAALIVVCDDVHLDPGCLRIRPEGSSGGQKGLESIAAALGTTGFARLRVGVGEPPKGSDLSDYVLGPPEPMEARRMQEALKLTVEALEVWAAEGVDAAMNRFNGLKN
ncbi:MAG: aminoacyl-tRNA hydrolase [Candidatus Omnitrophica bacterium]|nr:aminoacyl-tRNA hydrolase [Candidatus Omnitrophota bacterium]